MMSIKPCHCGLRIKADEYLALSNDGFRYELLDGIVYLSPRPSFQHQRTITEIARQLGNYLDRHRIGEAAHSIDFKLNENVVYRPDVIFLSNEKAARCGNAVTEVPDLIVEIISPDSRSFDTQTKRGDYEAAGVHEYWLIDPVRKTFCFYVLENGQYREAPSVDDPFLSIILPGFALDLNSIRRLF